MRLRYPKRWDKEMNSFKDKYNFESKADILRFSYNYTKTRLLNGKIKKGKGVKRL